MKIWNATESDRAGVNTVSRAGMISVSQNDTQGACQCPDCQAIVKEEGSESGPWIRLCNAVAAEVNKEFPDDANVQAAAELGLLDALNGKSDAGRRALTTSLEHAQRMGRHALAARSRLYLAKTYAIQRRFSEAERVLDQIPADDNDRTVGAELRAAISALRAEVLAQSG